MSIHPVSTCLRQDKIFWQTEQDDEYYPSPFPPFILIRWRTRNLPVSCTQPQIPVKHFVHMPGLYLTAPKQRGGSHGYTVHRGGRRQQLSHCSPLTSQRHSKVENKAAKTKLLANISGDNLTFPPKPSLYGIPGWKNFVSLVQICPLELSY